MSEKQVSMREAFGTALVELGRARPEVVVLDADLGSSTRAAAFEQAFPDRYIQCGIAEQNMVGMAAGLAAVGFLPFCVSFCTFIAKRATDQVNIAVTYPRRNVKLVGVYSGIFTGKTGATHQAVDDIAIMRALPNMTVIEPADNEECRQAVLAMGDHQGPCYLRVARDVLPAIFDGSHKFQVGRGVALRRGGDVTLVASGRMVTEALRAAIELEREGIGAAVIGMSTIKPLDVDLLVASARVTGAVVTAENASIIGGLGGAVAEALGENCPVPLVRVGVRDVYGESGPDDALAAKYGLGAPDIVAAARTAIRRKRR